MAARIRAHNWAATPLGPVEGWAQSLRALVDLMLATSQIATLAVGPERVFLYNDEASRHYGDHHPGVLGRKLTEAFPHEFAKVASFYDRVFAGEGIHVPAQMLAPSRTGLREVFDAYLAPVRDGDGRVIAAYMTGSAIGERQQAEARLRESEARQTLLLRIGDVVRTISNPAAIQQTAMRMLGEHLGLSRTYYFAVERENGGWVHVIEAAYQREPGGPTMVGRHTLEDFGAAMFEGFARGAVIAVADVGALAHVTPEELASYRALGVTAFVNVPLLRNGEYSAGIGAHDTEPHTWTEGEIDLIREVAARTWAAVERARAEEALRESEQSYHALFAASPVPFMVLAPDPPDFTVTAANDAYLAATLTSREGLAGRSVFDVFTADRSRQDLGGPKALRASLDRVLASGRPDAMPRTRYDIVKPDGGFEPRWWLAIHAPVFHASGKIKAIIHQVTDVTELHLAEAAEQERQARQDFLLKLSDALRPLADPAAIEETAARHIGEHLDAGRAYYVQLDEGRQLASVAREYRRDEYPSLIGKHGFSSYGATLDLLRTGKPVVFEDVESEARVSPADLPAHRALGLRAYVNTALVKDGELVAAMCVVSGKPRRWTMAEVALVEETGERTWAAIQRVRAETALRESEEMLAADLANAELLRGLAERLVTEDNVETIYDEILSAAIAIAQADAGTVQIFDPETRSLKLLATCNLSRTVTDRLRNVDASSRTACGVAMQTGQRTFVNADDEAGDAGCLLLVDAGFRTALAIPLASRTGRQLGMLNTHWRAANHRSTERQLRFLELIAWQTVDLMEHRQAQAVLRETGERLRQFGEASLDVLWIRDADTLQWTYLTPAFETIYGLSREEALTGDNYRRWQDLIVPEDRAMAVASIARVAGGERVTFEYRIRRPVDGQLRWLRNTDFPMPEGAGRVVQIGGVGHDITELKAVQAAVADSEARLRTLTEGIPQLVWRSCDKGLWTWASPQWLDYTGQTQEESHSLGWLDPVHPDDHAAAMQAWDMAQPHGKLDVEYRVRRASDGAWLWHRTRSVPVRGAPEPDGTEGPITEWLGTTTDIDDLKRLQNQQQILVAELQHRTRNLLAVVRNIARRSIDPSPGRDEYDARLAALGRVQGFLSRSTAYSVPLGDVVKAELQAAGDGASDKVEVGGPLVDLPGESVQAVALALHELATNAVKYGAITQPSARLTVFWRTETEEDGAQRLVIDWQESGVAMPAGQPARRGYGSELITRALPYQLRAETALEFTPGGVRCRIILPESAFSSRAEKQPA